MLIKRDSTAVKLFEDVRNVRKSEMVFEGGLKIEKAEEWKSRKNRGVDHGQGKEHGSRHKHR